jgi:CoA:oxalate CoA-transferase
MKPLENIKVLDLTRVLAGPYCTMLLSDLGAEVVKVEMPGCGDDSRTFGPFVNGKSLYFVSINKEKKSISLNLKSEKGKQIIREMVKKFDVVVENFRPGTMEKLGLGYEDLKQINPRIIYAASSGFGHTGPYAPKASYDILAQAMGGIMSITGWPDTPPTRVGMSLGDISAGMFLTIGILAALNQRNSTGEAQKVDVSMLDCQIAMLENAITRYQVEGVSPKPLGNRHPTIAPFQAYKASDDYFVIAVGNDTLWQKFCHAILRPQFVCDPRFKTNALRSANVNLLEEELSKIFSTRTAAEWVKIIDEAGVPCSPINKVDKILENPQLIARNMLVELNDSHAGKIKIAGNPVKISSLPECETRLPAPEIGEHNLEVFAQYLGLTASDLEILANEGVI